MKWGTKRLDPVQAALQIQNYVLFAREKPFFGLLILGSMDSTDSSEGLSEGIWSSVELQLLMCDPTNWQGAPGVGGLWKNALPLPVNIPDTLYITYITVNPQNHLICLAYMKCVYIYIYVGADLY